MVKPVSQEATLIQLDQDILDWFKSKEKGYQSLINSALILSIIHHYNALPYSLVLNYEE